MRIIEKCYRCGKSAEETRVQRCVICHRIFCRACAERRNGKALCSAKCVELFFFGDDENDETQSR